MNEVFLFFVVVAFLIKPMGCYIAKIYQSQFVWTEYLFGPIEDFLYRLAKINPLNEMSWQEYAKAVITVSILGFAVLFCILRFQFYLPLNPENLPNVPSILAFNISASFITNTNWQSYVPETTLSPFSQMLGLGVQNFLSASLGMAVACTMIRGLYRKRALTIGNFWVDWLRGCVYILLPLSIIFSIILGSQGVIQNFNQPIEIAPVSTVQTATKIPTGPVASQVAIKQLGSNGGGYFNTNSAHPFENPTPISNFFSMLAIILIPIGFFYAFGVMINDTRQGWALIIAMTLLFLPLFGFCLYYEFTTASLPDLNPGNFEGKEVRFGIYTSALWTSLTTATSNGSVNAMLDSFTPMGGFVPLIFMLLGEVVFGGVGSGLYGLLLYVILAVFITGLMAGRSPEYLGNKIQSFDIKMIAIALFAPFLYLLFSSAIAFATTLGTSSILNPGAHGLTEVFYAFASAVNNNGSAFAGLNSNTDLYNLLLGVAMLVGRYMMIIPVLALAGSLASKNSAPNPQTSMATHSLLFIFILMTIIVLFAFLSYLPILLFGPINEHLSLVTP